MNIDDIKKGITKEKVIYLCFSYSEKSNSEWCKKLW